MATTKVTQGDSLLDSAGYLLQQTSSSLCTLSTTLTTRGITVDGQPEI